MLVPKNKPDYNWKRNLAILMVLQFLVVGSMSMVVPFLALYLQELGMHDQDEISIWSGCIFGINFLSASLVAPLWGSFADKYGRKLMVLRSGFGMAVVAFLTGLASSPLQLLILRFINGMVSGFIPASVSLIAANTPKAHLGQALGLLQSGVMAGLILGPVLSGLLAQVLPFSQIFFLTGIILLLASAAAYWLVQEQFTPKPASRKLSFLNKSRSIFQRSTLLWLFAAAILMQMALLGPTAQMALFVAEIGIQGKQISLFTGLILATAGISNLVFAPILGKLGDKHGTGKVLVLSLAASALCFLPHVLAPTIWYVIGNRLFLGACTSGLLPLLNTLVRKHAPPDNESTAYGYQTSALCLGSTLGPALYGVICGVWGVKSIFLTSALLLACTALLIASQRNLLQAS